MSKILLVLAAVAVLAAPASAYYYVAGSDSFDYPNGNLNDVGDPPWTGSATNQIVVENSTVKLSYYQTSVVDARWVLPTAYSAPTGGKILVGLKVKRNVGTMQLFSVWAKSSGAAQVRWTGYVGGVGPPNVQGSIRGRDSGGNLTSMYGPLSTTSWTSLLITIDPVLQTASFNAGGTNLGSLTYSSSNLAQLYFENITNATSGSVYFDDLWYGSDIPEPGSMLALCVFGVGMVGYVRRRR